MIKAVPQLWICRRVVAGIPDGKKDEEDITLWTLLDDTTEEEEDDDDDNNDDNDNDNNNTKHGKINWNIIRKRCITHPRDISRIDPLTGRTILHKVSSYDDCPDDIYETIVAGFPQATRMQMKNSFLATPLHIILWKTSQHTSNKVEILLKYMDKHSVLLRNSFGNSFGGTALHLACTNNACLSAIQLVIKKNPKIVIQRTTKYHTTAIEILWSSYRQGRKIQYDVLDKNNIANHQFWKKMNYLSCQSYKLLLSLESQSNDKNKATTTTKTTTTTTTTKSNTEGNSNSCSNDNNDTDDGTTKTTTTNTTTSTSLAPQSTSTTTTNNNNNNIDTATTTTSNSYYYCFLHGLIYSYVPIEIMITALQWNTVYATQYDINGNYPLHIILEKRQYLVDEGDNDINEINNFIYDLIIAYPQVVCIQNNNGDIPLCIAIRNKMKWDVNETEGIILETMVKEDTEDTMIVTNTTTTTTTDNNNDSSSRLYPLLVAACIIDDNTNEDDELNTINTIYQFLLLKPHYLMDVLR